MTARRSGTPSTTSSMDTGTLAADFSRLGVPQQQVQAWAARTAGAADVAGEAAGDDTDLVLAPHLWPAVELGLTMRTQMRAVADPRPGAGVIYLGLDYAAMPAVKRDLGLPQRGPAARVLLHQLRVVEAEMVKVMNQQQAAE